jgi:hypothetical protein
MGEDGIDLLERLERLEKRVLNLEGNILEVTGFDVTIPSVKCDHNYPRLESTAGKTCSNCGKVMEVPFAPRESTSLRMHL